MTVTANANGRTTVQPCMCATCVSDLSHDPVATILRF